MFTQTLTLDELERMLYVFARRGMNWRAEQVKRLNIGDDTPIFGSDNEQIVIVAHISASLTTLQLALAITHARQPKEVIQDEQFILDTQNLMTRIASLVALVEGDKSKGPGDIAARWVEEQQAIEEAMEEQKETV